MTKKLIDEQINVQEHAIGESLDAEGAVLADIEAVQALLDQLHQHVDKDRGEVNERFSRAEGSRFLAAIGCMAEGVVTICSEGTIEIANPVARKLLGLTASSSLAEVKVVMENLGFQQPFVVQRHAVLQNGGEFISKTSAGRILQIKWNAIIDSDGQAVGNVVVIRDITAQVEIDRAQTEFISAISHELRTPLTIIQNSVSNMLAGVTGALAPKMGVYLNTMQGNCLRLARLINDLLDIAKIEAGRMPINRTVMNLAEVAARAVREFSGIAAEKGVRLELAADNCDPRVYVDAHRIYQVFSNLITNAIKYTNKGGSVSLSLFGRNEEVEVVVADTGIGIAAEHQKHIFNMFYQVTRQAGPGYNGSGLGLSLSSEIVSAHEGKMWVESEIGKGSKFHFSLPKPLPQIVVSKHLETLIEHADKRDERFVMMVVRLTVSQGGIEQNKQTIEEAMRQLLHAGEEMATANGDLVVRRGELEAVIILNQVGSRYLTHVKQRLHNAIVDVLMEKRCYDVVVPVAGIAVYPNDAATVEDLERKATSELKSLP
ncbi:MAG: ATP-binding protein [Sedimentisphaerales bacterium]|nr:ATP-binding protein [Sedimentisphaerales bacterium]